MKCGEAPWSCTDRVHVCDAPFASSAGARLRFRVILGCERASKDAAKVRRPSPFEARAARGHLRATEEFALPARDWHQCRLKYCTARSCFSAAARVANVPR